MNGKFTSAHSGLMKWQPRIAALTAGFADYARGAPSAAAYAIAQSEVMMAMGQPYVSCKQ